MGARARLGEILLEAGEIDAAQLEAALRRQDETGRPLGLTLVDMGALREETLVRTLSQQLALPMARLEGKRVGAEVLDLVPFDMAEKHRCFPLFVKEEGAGRALYLGMEDASDLDAIEALAGLTGMTIRPVLVAPTELEEALSRQYDALASGAAPPLGVPERDTEEAASGDLPPLQSDPGFDGTGLPADLEVDPDALSGDSDVDFDSRGLATDMDEGISADESIPAAEDVPAAEDAAADEADVPAPGEDTDWDAGPELGADDDDLEVDLDVERDLELRAGPGLEPEESASGPDSLADSLDDFAPELAVDAPGTHSLPREPEPPAPASPPVSRDAILRALTQLLVEKGLIDREELIARVHRESGSDG